jgi:adenylate kinase
LIDSSSRSLFEQAWLNQIEKRGGADKMNFPREMIFLTGAPGAGKGTQIGTVLRERDLQHSIEVSSLFKTPAFEAMKSTGKLLSDADVISVVIDALLDPKYSAGVVIDGFPRTAAQASAIVLLHEKLAERCAMHVHSANVALRAATRQPRFTLAVLWCDEAGTSRL